MDYARPLIAVQGQYSEKSKTSIVIPDTGKTLVFHGAVLNNRSGSTIALGITFKTADARWKAGQWTAAGNPEYTDDTTDAQSAATGDFPLFTTTNNDGFAVQNLDKFGLVGVTVSTAASGGTPVYAYAYWNGSSYAALTLIETPTWTSTGEKNIVFNPPIDWAVNSGQAVTDGLTAGYYSIRVIATTAASTAGGTADILWAHKLYSFKASVATDAVLNVIPETQMGVRMHGGESIAPYFGTAHANNSVEVRYSSRG